MQSRPPLEPAKTGRGREHRAELLFILRFAAIAGASMTLYAFPYSPAGAVHSWFTAYLSLYASVAGAVLHLLDSTVHVSGADIGGRYSLRIVKDCDAMDVHILFAAAVLAFPASWKKRALGLAVGCAAILVANVARICALYFVGISAPDSFEFAHRDLFPLLLVTLAMLVFFPWARRVREAQVTAPHAAA